jgi:carbonic anhydrase/acetyltransferase-like protein (isoleucine patch superfamily)
MALYQLGEFSPEMDGDEYWVAPSASVMGKVRLRRGASVWWGAVLRGDNEWIEVGEDTNIQDNAVLHTDMGSPLTIGAGVTVGHLAMLHGCAVGDNTLIGIGAVVLNGAKIGRNCLIAGKALIGENKEIPDNSFVMGIPGKVVREVGPELERVLTRSAQTYARNWRRFKAELKPLAG